MCPNPSRSVTIAYPGDRAAKASTISWYWLDDSQALSDFIARPTTPNANILNQNPSHTTELIPGNYSNFPSEYVLLDEYKLGRYLLFNQEYETGVIGPLSIGDVIPNFAEMRKFE